MLRSFLSLFAIAALSTSAAADEYSDTAKTYRFDMPDGWQTTLEPEVNLMILSPRNEQTGGNCNLIINDSEETKALTQAELDAVGAVTFTEPFWRSALEGAGLRNIKVEKVGARKQKSRNVFFVRQTSDVTVNNADITITQLQDVHLIPGRAFVLTCTALAAEVAQEEANFATIMTSFEPTAEVPTAMLRPPAPASLTLYERPRFAGVSRVITQDTEDLSRFGWRRSAASFSVSGSATWQVCDGANFSGRCRTLSGSDGAAPVFAVLSARRVAPHADDLSPLAASLGQGLKASLAQTRMRRH